MRTPRRSLSTRRARWLACLCTALAASASAGFVTDSFGGQGCSRPGTMKVETDGGLGKVVKFDLSAIPKGSAVCRAILKVRCNRRGYAEPVLLYPILRQGDKTLRGETSLPLRAPFYRDLDMTSLARKWVADPASNLGLVAASVPGWVPAATALHVSYEGEGKPTPAVTGLEAAFQNGQVFLRWRELEDIVGAEQIRFGDFEAKVLAAHGRRSVRYRIYRHTRPITAKTLAAATLVREVEEILPAYNLDAVPTTEFPGRNSRPSKLGVGGNRRTDVVVSRFVLPMKRQLASGENLVVMTSRQNGSFYYAVTAAVNGYEAVQEFGAGNSLAKPVKEKVEPVAPLLQDRTVRKRQNRDEVYETYVCFYEPPYWPTPLRVFMCSAYSPEEVVKPRAPLEICTGIYGGQAPYNLGRRNTPGAYYIAPPVTGAMWQGVHECVGTLKTYDDGLVRNYTHRQIFDIIKWAKKKWPIDPDAIVINGQFAIWALRHADTFAMVYADPYGNFAAGREMQNWGWAWGPYPRGARNEDGGVDQWEYLNIAKWIRENPTIELPFYIGRPEGATHVGDMGFMPCPEVYQALLHTRRAFAARWGHSLGTRRPGISGWLLRRNTPVPAFTHCSLDDMIGEGDQWGGAGGGTIGSGDPSGQFNDFLRWDPEGIVDQPDRFEVTIWLAKGALRPECTVDLTPRRCQRFRGRPGQRFGWVSTSLQGGEVVQNGTAEADGNGLVTVAKLQVGFDKARVRISRTR